MFHGFIVWFRYVINGFIFDLNAINNWEMTFSFIMFLISNLFAFFYVVPNDEKKHPSLLGFPGDIWILIYYWLIEWSFWNTWLLWRFIPSLYPDFLNNLYADKILSMFFLFLPVPHAIKTFQKIMSFMGSFHSVQLSLWISFILAPINICLFISGQQYIDDMDKCWRYQTDFIVAMCYFTNWGYMVSFFMVTLYRKRVPFVRNKFIFAILFVFTLMFMGFIPMITLVIYPDDTSFLNWVSEEMFGGKGNIFGETSCQYPQTAGTMTNNAYLNGTTVFSIATCAGVAWMCYVLVKYATNATIG